ncbi:MAG: type II toxin-antitoxin system RelE/ParE family toxin [Rhizomicrobium sp.]
MIQLLETETFSDWLSALRDVNVRARVQRRLDRLRLGNPGDVKPVGEGVSEMRIDYGPGYRVYYIQRGQTVIVLLAGGDKRSQPRDIATALGLARSLKEMK